MRGVMLMTRITGVGIMPKSGFPYRGYHQPSRLEQIVNLKILDLACQHDAGVMLTKTLLAYKSACPARNSCVQHVSRGRD